MTWGVGGRQTWSGAKTRTSVLLWKLRDMESLISSRHLCSEIWEVVCLNGLVKLVKTADWQVKFPEGSRYNENKMSPRTDPWGTSQVKGAQVDTLSSADTRKKRKTSSVQQQEAFFHQSIRIDQSMMTKPQRNLRTKMAAAIYHTILIRMVLKC